MGAVRKHYQATAVLLSDADDAKTSHFEKIPSDRSFFLLNRDEYFSFQLHLNLLNSG